MFSAQTWRGGRRALKARFQDPRPSDNAAYELYSRSGASTHAVTNAARGPLQCFVPAVPALLTEALAPSDAAVLQSCARQIANMRRSPWKRRHGDSVCTECGRVGVVRKTKRSPHGVLSSDLHTIMLLSLSWNPLVSQCFSRLSGPRWLHPLERPAAEPCPDHMHAVVKGREASGK